MTAPDTDRLREIAADLLARLSESWSSMGWVAAPKIARILKERQEAAKTISALLADNARLLGEVERLTKRANDCLREWENAYRGYRAAEAALERAREGLKPFAWFDEFIKSETEGFSDTDRLEVYLEESGHLLTVFEVIAFRRAAEVYARLQPQPNGEDRG